MNPVIQPYMTCHISFMHHSFHVFSYTTAHCSDGSLHSRITPSMYSLTLQHVAAMAHYIHSCITHSMYSVTLQHIAVMADYIHESLILFIRLHYSTLQRWLITFMHHSFHVFTWTATRCSDGSLHSFMHHSFHLFTYTATRCSDGSLHSWITRSIYSLTLQRWLITLMPWFVIWIHLTKTHYNLSITSVALQHSATMAHDTSSVTRWMNSSNQDSLHVFHDSATQCNEDSLRSSCDWLYGFIWRRLTTFIPWLPIWIHLTKTDYNHSTHSVTLQHSATKTHYVHSVICYMNSSNKDSLQSFRDSATLCNDGFFRDALDEFIRPGLIPCIPWLCNTVQRWLITFIPWFVRDMPQTEEIGLKIIPTAKIRGSPRNFQTSFHGSPQNISQVVTGVNGSYLIIREKRIIWRSKYSKSDLLRERTHYMYSWMTHSISDRGMSYMGPMSDFTHHSRNGSCVTGMSHFSYDALHSFTNHSFINLRSEKWNDQSAIGKIPNEWFVNEWFVIAFLIADDRISDRRLSQAH